MAADKTSVKGLVYAPLFGVLTAAGGFYCYFPAVGTYYRANIFLKYRSCALGGIKADFPRLFCPYFSWYFQCHFYSFKLLFRLSCPAWIQSGFW
jgi:hypothetical protein